MLLFKLEQSPDLVAPHAGLALMGEFTIGLDVLEALDKSLPVPAVNLEAELLVATLQSIPEQLDHAQQAMRELAESFPEYDNRKSIPGFGPYVSAVALGAIGNPIASRTGPS